MLSYNWEKKFPKTAPGFTMEYWFFIALIRPPRKNFCFFFGGGAAITIVNSMCMPFFKRNVKIKRLFEAARQIL